MIYQSFKDILTRYALLCGSAPENYRQKKLNDMFDSLSEKDGWNVTCMANGSDEFMLDFALNNVLDGNTDDEVSGLFLYFCTKTPVADSEKTFWLGENEIRKDVIEHYAKLFAESGIDFQVVYDSDREMVSEEELGYEKLSEDERREFVAKVKSGAIRIG